MMENKGSAQEENREFIPRRNETQSILGAVVSGFVAGAACVLSLLKILKE